MQSCGLFAMFEGKACTECQKLHISAAWRNRECKLGDNDLLVQSETALLALLIRNVIMVIIRSSRSCKLFFFAGHG